MKSIASGLASLQMSTPMTTAPREDLQSTREGSGNLKRGKSGGRPNKKGKRSGRTQSSHDAPALFLSIFSRPSRFGAWLSLYPVSEVGAFVFLEENQSSEPVSYRKQVRIIWVCHALTKKMKAYCGYSSNVFENLATYTKITLLILQ